MSQPSAAMTRGGPHYAAAQAAEAAAATPSTAMTRGGPRYAAAQAAESAAEQAAAENKYTGINLNAAAKLEEEEADNGYFSWKLSQRQTKEQRNNPAKYEAEFRQRYKNHLAGRGGRRRSRTRKHKTRKHKKSRKHRR